MSRAPAATEGSDTAQTVTSKRKPSDLFASKWLRARAPVSDQIDLERECV